jgi:hypothetical protein
MTEQVLEVALMAEKAIYIKEMHKLLTMRVFK